jgi:copper(I)-binding protein
VSLLFGGLLSGCGVGQNTQTARQESVVNGAGGQVGAMVVRNVELAVPDGGQRLYAKGSNAPLTGTVVNTGSAEDELVSVSSSAASSAQIEGQRTLPAQVALRAVAPKKSGDVNATLNQGELRVILENLTEDVVPGKTIRITFLFRQAGELNLDVPIATPEGES